MSCHHHTLFICDWSAEYQTVMDNMNYSLVLLILSVLGTGLSTFSKGGGGGGGHGHGHGGYGGGGGSGTACIVKGSYCQCHYCKCEHGHVKCKGYGSSGGYGR